MASKQRRPWWTGRVTGVNVWCAVLLPVRLRPTWKHLTCWNPSRCFFYSLFLDLWKSLSDVESIFEKQHKSPVITDAKSLYDALERSESSTRNLTVRRTAIEVTLIRQRLDHGFIYTGWVSSDRQMADGLTKPQAAWKLLEIMSAGRWKIVWDATFGSARKLKVAERSEGKRDFHW